MHKTKLPALLLTTALASIANAQTVPDSSEVTYSYDDSGRISQVTDETAAQTLTFDAGSNLTAVTTTVAQSQASNAKNPNNGTAVVDTSKQAKTPGATAQAKKPAAQTPSHA